MRPTSLGVECVSATWRKMLSGLPAAAASLARAMLFSYVRWSMTSQTNTSAPRASLTMFAEYAVSPEKQIERVLVSKR